jgi:hypothetical protein
MRAAEAHVMTSSSSDHESTAPGPGGLTALPPELHYLIEPALKYGIYQFDDDIYRFMQSASEDDVRTLHELGRTVRENGHYDRVLGFLDRFDSWPAEVAKLYFLFGVMDAIDVSFA